NMKSLNQAAYILLVIWIIAIIYGIFTLIISIINLNAEFIWFIYFSNLLSLVPYALLFFPTLQLYVSFSDIIKNRKLEEYPKLIKSLIIQFLISAIASIIVVLMSGEPNLSDNLLIDFFALFSLWIFLISIIAFLIYILYSYFGEV
ncbi:MAG: hypothetical protein ACFE8L_02320, partial [Candidatus Hodarchaeota archaeon]